MNNPQMNSWLSTTNNKKMLMQRHQQEKIVEFLIADYMKMHALYKTGPVRSQYNE
jgi:hypothetical protein